MAAMLDRSRSFARSMPGTATMSRTRSFRPGISTPRRGSIPAARCIRRSARSSPSTAGPNQPSMPPYVAFQTSRSHIARGGYLGRQYDPFIANRAAELPDLHQRRRRHRPQDAGPTSSSCPAGLTQERLPIAPRRCWKTSIACARRIDRSAAIDVMDRHAQAAVDLLVGRRAHETFDLSREPAQVRERYGKHLWCQQALLARRLVEAGVVVRDDRPELPPGLGHLGQPRRQHPALRRHQQGPEAAAAALRSPDHDAGRRPGRARPARRRAGHRDGRIRPHAR